MLLVNKGFAYIWLSSGLICRMYPEAQREDGRWKSSWRKHGSGL